MHGQCAATEVECYNEPLMLVVAFVYQQIALHLQLAIVPRCQGRLELSEQHQVAIERQACRIEGCRVDGWTVGQGEPVQEVQS